MGSKQPLRCPLVCATSATRAPASQAPVPAASFVSGWFGGAAGVIASHPLDTIRVQVQVAAVGKRRSILSYARRTVAAEGFFGLYKGVWSPVMVVGVWKATVFSAYTAVLSRAFHTTPTDGSMTQLAAASAMAAVVGAYVVAAPMEIIKCTSQTTKMKGSSVVRHEARTARAIVRNHGVTGLWRGASLLAVSGSMSFPVWFCVHEAIMRRRTEAYGGDRKAVPLWEQLLSGGFAGTLSWFPAFPTDKLKAMWQTDFSHKSMLGMIRSRIQAEGPGPLLYRGLVATLARGAPQTGVTMAAYELCMRQFRTDDSEAGDAD